MKNPQILFGMAHPGFYRNFAFVIQKLLENDINVHVHFSKNHKTITMNDYSLPTGKGFLTFSTNEIENKYISKADKIRTIRDILHYSRREFKYAINLRERFISMQKSIAISHVPIKIYQIIFSIMPLFLKKYIDKYLKNKDTSISVPIETTQLLNKIKPQYVIVTPLVNFSSKETDLVKAAKALNIPTLLATASWDNLTTKGKIMIPPDHIAVWNKAMVKEAIELHEISEKKIWVTGAPVFDSWFNRKPSQSKKKFCANLKFDQTKPIIVYLCSSHSIAGKREDNIVRLWKKTIHNSNDERLISANILIRPHPMALSAWQRLFPNHSSNIGKIWGLKIWPLNAKHPTSEEMSAIFFDTLYYADILVGLNTSAMIEAAILEKPIFTFRGHEATSTQTGNLHFQHLVGSSAIVESKNLKEHVEQLRNALDTKIMRENKCPKFISEFIRPLGENQNSAEILAKYIIREIKNNSL